MSSDPLNIAGQVVAEKYQIEQLVGEGGFAVVYRAVHTIWQQPVAIKFFNGLSSAPAQQRDELVDQFIQEGKLLTELSSKTVGIVQARDVGSYVTPAGAWMPYMVLEWLDGAPLDAVLHREWTEGAPTWSVPEVTSFLRRVLPTLEVAHSSGVAHRDIKPANFFVLGDARKADTQIKLLDFGVAKMVADNTHMKAALAKTGVGITSFTPQYGAPEQFSRSHGATGPWTDVYALALVAVELLTGQEALAGDDLVQLGFATSDPSRRPTPRSKGVALPSALEALFVKALAVSPEQRYASAGEFLRALDAAQSGAIVDAKTALAPEGSTSELVAGPLGAAQRSPRPALPTSVAGPASKANSGKANSGKAALISIGGVIALAALAGVWLVSGSGSAPPTDAAAGPSSPSTASRLPATGATAASNPPQHASGVSAASAAASIAAAAPSCPPDMALIPAGQFFQGSDAPDAPDNQKPSHNVKLEAFCIDSHEVTAGSYKRCSDQGKCKRPRNENQWPSIKPQEVALYSELCTFGVEGKESYPINCVSWDMADIYCKAQGRRLPTESEWEYATRGPDGRVYPWGDDEPTAEHLNSCDAQCMAWGKKNRVPLQALHEQDDGYATLAPVGKYPKGRSRFGPYDVVGNVWEWVADWDGAYGSAPQNDPTGPETGERRVIRGGGWNGGFEAWLHPAFRYAQVPSAMSHGIGFRCAKSLND